VAARNAAEGSARNVAEVPVYPPIPSCNRFAPTFVVLFGPEIAPMLFEQVVICLPG